MSVETSESLNETWAKWQGCVVNDTFLLRRYLGCSDHSGVFLAESAEREPSQVTVKLVPATSFAESQLARWEAAAGLTHPHLIRILETGRCQLGDSPCLYVAMEYADQGLAELLPRRPLTELEAREILLPILGVLTFLHNRNLVHGQLKPANLLAVGEQLKLAGDTIRRVSEAMTGVNIVSAYDPPEAREGNCSTASDVWALGVTLYESLTRTLPPGLDDRRGGVVLPPDFSPTFREMITWCLSRRPYDRPKLAEIEAWVRRQSGESHPGEPPQPAAAGLPEVTAVESTSVERDSAHGMRHQIPAPEVITAEPTASELGLSAAIKPEVVQRAAAQKALNPAAGRAAAKRAAVQPPTTRTAAAQPTSAQGAGASGLAVKPAVSEPAQTAAEKSGPPQTSGAPAAPVKPVAQPAGAQAVAAAALRAGVQPQMAAAHTTTIKPTASQVAAAQAAAVKSAAQVAADPPIAATRPAAAQTAPIQTPTTRPAAVQMAPAQTAAIVPTAARATIVDPAAAQVAANEALAAKLAAAAQMAASQPAAKSAAAKIAAVEAAAREITASQVGMLASSIQIESVPEQVLPAAQEEDAAEEGSRQRRPVLLMAIGAVAILALVWASVVVFMTHPSKAAPPLPAQASEDAPPQTPPEPEPMAVPVSEPAPVLASGSSDTPNIQQPPVETITQLSGIHEEFPGVPGRVLKTIHGHVRVSVRVIVDKGGTVFAALVDEPGPSRYFERLALEAAKKWTFPPVAAKPRRLELVRFDFTREGTTGDVVPIQ
jgi:Protein kinase domain